jgi:ribosomal protein S18 acetylase RimI-like enzyme
MSNELSLGPSANSRPPGSPLAIRNATAQDVASVLALWNAASDMPTVTDTSEGLTRLLAADAGALIVAESDGALVGSLIAAWDGWRGSFYRLAVHPASRRQGIARALVREGERRLGALGAVRLTAIVIDDDPTAMAFWKAAGYARQQRRARFVTPDLARTLTRDSAG